MLRWLVDHAGLQQPCRFDRTVTVLAALALAMVVGAVAVLLSLRDELTPQTPRGWHFLYLAGLLALALALACRPRLVQTAFYQQSFGVEPACAVCYIGWNDLRNASIVGLDPGYADYHLRSTVDVHEARRAVGPLLSVSPTPSLLGRLAGLAFDTVRPARSRPRGDLSAQHRGDFGDQPPARRQDDMDRTGDEPDHPEVRADRRVATVRAREGRMAPDQPPEQHHAARGNEARRHLC